MRSRINLLTKSFGTDEQGSVAMIFGLMSIALLFMAGMAVDFNRITNMRQRVADAVDSASLAAGRALLDGKLSDSEIEDLAKLYFTENVKNAKRIGSVEDPKVIVDRQAGSVTIDVNSSVPMTLTRLGGFKDIDVPVSSAAVFQQKDIEVGMALDVTGSMSRADAKGKSKLAGLKQAFASFADRLIPEQPNPAQKVRIALAPYSASVSLGNYAGAVSQGRSQDGCVTERKSLAATDNVESFLVAEDGKKDTDPTEGIPANDAYLCPTSDIVPLSDDKDLLIAKVNAFSANGWTAGHTGIQWAWNLVSDKWTWTGSEPDSYERIKDGKLIKAVVLMTDGIFNTAYHGAKSSKQAIALCDAMKAKGVMVFAVAFETPWDAADKATLQTCSSGSEFFANASSAEELTAIFDKFAAKLTELRLAK